jgi:hypothetical protein
MPRVLATTLRYAVVVVFVGGLVYLYSHPESLRSVSRLLAPVLPVSGRAPRTTTPVLPDVPLWIRPHTAPNGSPWPKFSTYIENYPRLNVDGRASVTADNSRGRSDLFVKLFDRDQKPAQPVRVILLRAHDELTFQNVKAGHYDIRYRNLDTGLIRKSPKFEVTFTRDERGEKYMGWTVPLYEAINGTIHHEIIAERDFH